MYFCIKLLKTNLFCKQNIGRISWTPWIPPLDMTCLNLFIDKCVFVQVVIIDNFEINEIFAITWPYSRYMNISNVRKIVFFAIIESFTILYTRWNSPRGFFECVHHLYFIFPNILLRHIRVRLYTSSFNRHMTIAKSSRGRLRLDRPETNMYVFGKKKK